MENTDQPDNIWVRSTYLKKYNLLEVKKNKNSNKYGNIF